jgi:hypothetical protein
MAGAGISMVSRLLVTSEAQDDRLHQDGKDLTYSSSHMPNGRRGSM